VSALIRIRRDTTAAWNTGPIPTLADGEFGLDTTLRQIKMGDGSSAWNNLPWLGGTLPYFASPSADIDDASNRVMGLYRFADIAAITGGTAPAAPIDIKTADGGINMLVLPFGSVVVQQLWTDGDGINQPQKSYTRVYDGAWRAWTPQSFWAVDATEGVDAVVRSLDVKDDANIDGNATVKGNIIAGDAPTDTIQAQAGSAALPSVTFQGDLNTGAYSPAADEYAIATNGVRRLHQTNTTTTVDENLVAAKNFQVNGQLSGGLNCGGQLLTNLGAATSAAGAMRLDDLVALQRISMFYRGGTNGTVTGSDGVTNFWTVAGIGGGTVTATANAHNWRGLAFGIDSAGNIMTSAIQVKSSDTTQFSITASSGNISGIIVIAYRKQ